MPSNSNELDKILDCIVSQEAITEGGWAEYTTDPEAIKYGNPLHNKDELKQAIEALIQKEVIEARIDEQDQIYDIACDSLPEGSDFNRFVVNLEKRQKTTKALNQANKENK